jgi:hypothetical protein
MHNKSTQDNQNKPKIKSELDLIKELTPLPAPVWVCLLGQVFYALVIISFTFWALSPRH